MTGSFAFDDFCYTVDPKPRFGVKCEHNRTWHRLPQLLIKFMTEDRELVSKVSQSPVLKFYALGLRKLLPDLVMYGSKNVTLNS